MSLASEAKALTARNGGQCRVARLLAILPADQRSELIEALGDETIQSRALTAAAKLRGWDLPDQTVRRHRRGLCRCP